QVAVPVQIGVGPPVAGGVELHAVAVTQGVVNGDGPVGRNLVGCDLPGERWHGRRRIKGMAAHSSTALPAAERSAAGIFPQAVDPRVLPRAQRGPPNSRWMLEKSSPVLSSPPSSP